MLNWCFRLGGVLFFQGLSATILTLLYEMVVWSLPPKNHPNNVHGPWNGAPQKNEKTDLSVSFFCNSVLERTPLNLKKLHSRISPIFFRKNLPCSPGKLSKNWHKVAWVGLKQKHRWGLVGWTLHASMWITNTPSHLVAFGWWIWLPTGWGFQKIRCWTWGNHPWLLHSFKLYQFLHRNIINITKQRRLSFLFRLATHRRWSNNPLLFGGKAKLQINFHQPLDIMNPLLFSIIF